MPLFRSGSAKSTLSTMQRRSNKFQKFLTMTNVCLVIISTLIIFTAVVLIKFYHIDKLNFWSVYFTIVPFYTISLGLFTFLTCLFGFAVCGTEKTLLVGLYAVLLTIAFLAQLGSIFTSLELRSIIERAGVHSAAVNKDLSQYSIDSGITAKWDDLQRTLHCCGGLNFLTGYNDYRTTPIGNQLSVPDSCCHQHEEGCGLNVFKLSPEQIRTKIFTDGCLTTLQDRLESDVINMLVIYAVIGVIVALIEVVSVVIAAAFIAQVRRRRQREDRGWRPEDEARGGNESFRQIDGFVTSQI